jgi:hypothetical protein
MFVLITCFIWVSLFQEPLLNLKSNENFLIQNIKIGWSPIALIISLFFQIISLFTLFTNCEFYKILPFGGSSHHYDCNAKPFIDETFKTTTRKRKNNYFSFRKFTPIN